MTMSFNVFYFCSQSSRHLRRFSRFSGGLGRLLSCVRFGAHRNMLGFLILLFFLLLLHKPHLIFCLFLLDFWPSNVDQLVHRATRECLGFVVENKNIAIFLRENIWNWRFISIHGTYRFPVWGSPWSRGFPDSGSSRFSWLSAPATCQSARQWKPTMLRGIW